MVTLLPNSHYVFQMTLIMQLCCLQGFFHPKFLAETYQMILFVFLISSAKQKHTFLKPAKAGLTPWYRYELVKSNMPQSRAFVFVTLLGNERIEAGRTFHQTCLLSTLVFQRSCPWKSVAQLLFGKNPDIFTGAKQRFQHLTKECLVHQKNVPCKGGQVH